MKRTNKLVTHLKCSAKTNNFGRIRAICYKKIIQGIKSYNQFNHKFPHKTNIVHLRTYKLHKTEFHHAHSEN